MRRYQLLNSAGVDELSFQRRLLYRVAFFHVVHLMFVFNVFLSLHTEYIQKYATEEALKEQEEGAGDSSSESSMSDFSEDEAQDMEL